MAISVNRMNECSVYALNGLIEATAGGFAGEEILESFSLGAFFGVTTYAVSTVTKKWLFAVFPLNDAKASTAAKVVARLVVGIFSLLATVGLLAAAGVTMTVPVVTGMIIGTFWRSVLMQIAFGICCRCGETTSAAPPAPAAPQGAAPVVI